MAFTSDNAQTYKTAWLGDVLKLLHDCIGGETLPATTYHRYGLDSLAVECLKCLSDIYGNHFSWILMYSFELITFSPSSRQPLSHRRFFVLFFYLRLVLTELIELKVFALYRSEGYNHLSNYKLIGLTANICELF